MMSSIKSKNTKPEVFFRKLLFNLGFRFRINSKVENINVDIVLKKYNLCIFVNGCFWHRHKNCKLSTNPKSNTQFWLKKFNDNVERDIRIFNKLKDASWNIGVIWECEYRNNNFETENLIKLIKSKQCWEIPGNN